MKGKETIDAAKKIAEANRQKPVYNKGNAGEKLGETHQMVSARRVTVTMPNEGVYHDLSDDEYATLEERCIDLERSIHDFEFEVDEPKAKEPKAKN